MNIVRFCSFYWTLCLYVTALGQHSSIKGELRDFKGEPIGFNDIALLRLPDSLQMANTITNEQGSYTFSEVPKGDYLVFTHMSDLDESISKEVAVVLPDTTYHIDLVLNISIEKEQDVVITSQKAMVRQDADKLVMNVENTLANSGLTSADVLRRVPGVSVDRDGRVTIKGRGGVQVMLDDKVLYMSEEQLGNLLKSIPSDLIKEIEVVTSPSAKYDAVGNAGIINIRLKQGAYEGLNGNAATSLGAGVYHKGSAGVNVSYKKKKMSLDAGYQYNNREGLSDYYTHRVYKDLASKYSRFNSDAYFRLPEYSHSALLKGSYELGKMSNLGFNFNAIQSKFNWNGGTTSMLYNREGGTSNVYRSEDKGYSKSMNLNYGVDFVHRFDTLGTKLDMSVSMNTLRGFEDKKFDIQYYDSLNVNMGNPFLFLMNNRNTSDQLSAKADFTKNIIKGIKLETGVKSNMLKKFDPRNISISEGGGNERDASNHFLYNEDIYAAYMILGKKIKKWKFQGGLRLENTRIEGVQPLQDTTFRRNYTDFFPSGNITYNANEETSYTLLYSRRIQRPGGDMLNPVLNIVDPYTSWGGNPYLLPEYTDNAEFVYSMFAGYLIATANYSHTINPLNWVTRVDPNSLQTVSGFLNLKNSNNVGLSMAMNMPITKWWQTSNYVYVFRNQIVGDLGFGETVNQSNSWNANSTQTFKLPNRVSLELSGNYDAPSAYGLGISLERWQVSAAVQKIFFNDKLSVKVAFTDMFWAYQYSSRAVYGTIHTNGGYKWDNRVLMFTFNYKFGRRVVIGQ